MNRYQRIAGAQRSAFLSLIALTAAGGMAFGQQTIVYTTDADFDTGVSDHVNHTVVHDQLQLDVNANFVQPFVCLSLSNNGTMVRFDANTGAFFGEYATAPNGLGTNPSRIDIDSKGNAWVGNRGEAGNVGGVPKGSVAKIGIVLGGTRSNSDGSPNPNGAYVKGPFAYNTCVDRNQDGLIHTSHGLSDILPWPNITDGDGGADGIVHDAADECILIYQRTDGLVNRHISVDANDNVWVGGYPDAPSAFDKLDGNTGAILTSFAPTCGGHGGILSPSGILWSTSLGESSLMRYDTLTNTQLPCIPIGDPHGLTIDNNGFIWVAQFDLNKVAKFAPDGTFIFSKRSGGTGFDRALAVTPVDDNVWIGSGVGSDFIASPNLVIRLDNNGNQLKSIDVSLSGGLSPRGIAVDTNGKVWIGNYDSNNAQRIDPHGGGDGLGAVDLTIPLGTLAHRNPGPYNIGNFTGKVDAGITQPNGSWTVVYNSGSPSTEFGVISYSSFAPPSTSLNAEYRVANSVAALDQQTFVPVVNGQHFSGVFGQFMQVRVNFLRANPAITASPILTDLTIQTLGGPTPCAAGSPYPGSLLVFPEFDNRTGDMTIVSVTDTASSGNNVDVEYVYIGRVGAQNQLLNCLEFNRTEHFTPNDTLSVITKAHNPNQNQGYVYVFAKDKTTGQAIVHNSLIGNELIINGIQVLSYSNNPFVFPGIGSEGTPTDHDGDGIRDLNNVEYGCAPDQLLVPRFLGQVGGGGPPPGPAGTVHSDLILLNLTGGAAFTATIDFLIYNDNEEEFSAQTSFQCWVKRPLHDVSAVFDNSFLLTTNHALNESVQGVETGWFRMDGNVANSVATSFADPAFLAALVETTSNSSVSDLPFELGTQSNGGLLPTGIFGDTTP